VVLGLRGLSSPDPSCPSTVIYGDYRKGKFFWLELEIQLTLPRLRWPAKGMQRTLVWRFDGRLLVAVHGFKSPTNLEWQRFLNEGTAHGMGPHLRILIISHGGGPDGDQRKRLGQVIGAAPAPTVVMTGSALVRGITSAMTFFNPHMKAVNIYDTELAFEHLGLTPEERSKAQQLRRELSLELGLEFKAGAR
jgi:hypothetical protein